jgi:hypothetical protein
MIFHCLGILEEAVQVREEEEAVAIGQRGRPVTSTPSRPWPSVGTVPVVLEIGSTTHHIFASLIRRERLPDRTPTQSVVVDSFVLDIPPLPTRLSPHAQFESDTTREWPACIRPKYPHEGVAPVVSCLLTGGSRPPLEGTYTRPGGGQPGRRLRELSGVKLLTVGSSANSAIPAFAPVESLSLDGTRLLRIAPNFFAGMRVGVGCSARANGARAAIHLLTFC